MALYNFVVERLQVVAEPNQVAGNIRCMAKSAMTPEQARAQAPLATALKGEIKKRMSAQALADELGMPVASLRRYVNNERPIPGWVIFEACRVLGLTLEDFGAAVDLAARQQVRPGD